LLFKKKDQSSLLDQLKKWYEDGLGYHTITLPDGHTLSGIFDMSKVIHHYQMPENLNGKSVLDIGPGNGYFSFEFSKRGASKIVAIDKYDDYWNEELAKLMCTNVKFRVLDIENLDDSIGKFDIVFCSNVLLHLDDIYGAIKKIKNVTKEKAILATAILAEEFNDTKFVQFSGLENYVEPVNRIVGSYWIPSLTSFKKMAETAGFRTVKEISTFLLSSDPNHPKKFWPDIVTVRMAVLHCYV